MLGPRPQCICHQSRFGASRASGHITRLRVSSRQHAVSNSSAVVDQILNMIKDTDGGMSLSDDKKGEVDLLLDQLEEAGSGSAPLIDPRLMGNYEVAYTSTRNASSQSGNPAGGRFRGTLGRAIFSTTGLYQSVLTVPDNPTPVVTNKVSFKALGILDGAVGLRGVIEPVGDDNATVKVLFDPPVLTLKDSLHLRIEKGGITRLRDKARQQIQHLEQQIQHIQHLEQQIQQIHHLEQQIQQIQQMRSTHL